jgi:CBS domain-containing protein
MLVREIMTEDVVTVSPATTVDEIARRMTERNVGCVVVAESKRDVVGLITDRALVTRVLGEGRDPSRVRAQEIMTEDVVTVGADQNVIDAARVLAEAGPFRRAPVVDGMGNLVGILSIAELALVAHALLEPVLAEAERSVGEIGIETHGFKRELAGRAR